jgi:uncharacterized protein involved in exopolysaccharide biosynthesis
MTTADAWTYAAPGSAYRPADGWSSRTRFAPADFVTLLWRERDLMAGIFVALFALGLAFAFTLKTGYEAHSSVVVRLGQEYVYQPRAGDAGRGAVPDNDAVIQSEVEIMGSAPLKERVIERIGLQRIYPKLKDSKDAEAHQEAISKAVLAMEKSLKIETAPDTPVIRLAFKHEDPQMAARVLNTLLDEYLIYRQTVLLQSNAPALQAQRVVFEQKLAAADAALEAFMTFNDIGDFDAEKTSLNQLQVQLEQQRYSISASLRERQASLSTLTSQFASVPAQITLYSDANLKGQEQRDTLVQERTELLSRFRPGSDRVKALDEKIAAYDAAQTAARPAGDTARRSGPNPVYQTLLTEKTQRTAEVAGLQQSLAAVTEQIRQVTDRQMRLAQLEPRYQALVRDRGILQQNVTDFTAREQESLANAAIAGRGTDNIGIVGRATAPTEGSSLKKPVAILALLFAGFTALMAGLLHIFLRPGVSTPLSAGRTLDLPVLATARVKR